MRDINNIGLNSRINPAIFKTGKLKNTENSGSDIDTDEITSFANPKEEALGRSQVVKNVDSIEDNIKFMMRNPKHVARANKFFDKMFESLVNQNVDESYERASNYMKIFQDEFSNII